MSGSMAVSRPFCRSVSRGRSCAQVWLFILNLWALLQDALQLLLATSKFTCTLIILKRQVLKTMKIYYVKMNFWTILSPFAVGTVKINSLVDLILINKVGNLIWNLALLNMNEMTIFQPAYYPLFTREWLKSETAQDYLYLSPELTTLFWMKTTFL